LLQEPPPVMPAKSSCGAPGCCGPGAASRS
jgi:hypothetical protein